MIRGSFNNLEDSRRPLLGPNYWLLTIIGLILPEKLITKVLFILIHEFVAVFVVTQYIELFVIRTDLDLVITNLKVSIVSIVCIVKANTFVFWQASWKEVIEYVTNADIYERNDSDKIMNKILNSYTSYCRRLMKFYSILILSTFLSVTGTPLIKYVSSPNYREEIKNGTEPLPHIFSSWIPFDKYSFPGYWITIVYHVVMCGYGALMMVAYDSTVMVIMEFFCGKLELLRERCKKIFGCDGKGVSEDQSRNTIREIHNIHIHLMKYSRLFNSLLSPVMFLYVVMCSFLLCASAFQLTSATNTTQKVLMAEYLIFGIAQLFMFCWHSNKVLDQSNRVMLGPYESEWWAVGAKQRKDVFILTEQLKVVHVYTAGPFTQLTLTTFITILKGAYSYYALLRS